MYELCKVESLHTNFRLSPGDALALISSCGGSDDCWTTMVLVVMNLLNSVKMTAE